MPLIGRGWRTEQQQLGAHINLVVAEDAAVGDDA